MRRRRSRSCAPACLPDRADRTAETGGRAAPHAQLRRLRVLVSTTISASGSWTRPAQADRRRQRSRPDQARVQNRRGTLQQRPGIKVFASFLQKRRPCFLPARREADPRLRCQLPADLGRRACRPQFARRNVLASDLSVWSVLSASSHEPLAVIRPESSRTTGPSYQLPRSNDRRQGRQAVLF